MKYLLFVSLKYGFPIVRPLQKEILARGEEVVWFLEDVSLKNILTEKEIILETVEQVIDYGADINLVASNEIPHFFPGIKVQLFHGFSVNKRSKERGHFRIRGFFDLYCTQGPSTTNEFKKLKKKYKHFDVIETGWSKVDILFPVVDEYKSKPVVFLASTFTPSLSLAYDDLFFEEIVRLIEKNNWDWIVNLHPKMNESIIAKFKALDRFENVTYIPYLETLEPLKKASILITDTTSVITEFMIQSKPVVTYKNNLPQSYMIDVKNVRDIERACEQAITPSKELMDKINAFIDLEHPYFDGKSSERVINAVSEFYKGQRHKQLKRKPLNLIRKFKIRRKYNYYKSLWG